MVAMSFPVITCSYENPQSNILTLKDNRLGWDLNSRPLGKQNI
jgi:hypothetical protein